MPTMGLPMKSTPAFRALLAQFPRRIQWTVSENSAAGRAPAGSTSGWDRLKARRWLAIARVNPWWFEPFLFRSLDALSDKHETQMLLGKVKGGHLAVLCLAGPSSRSILQRGVRGTVLRTEADPGVKGAQPVLAVAWAASPAEAVRTAMERARSALGTFQLAKDKPQPEFAQWFGWCTWDAFYKEVTDAKIRQGLRSLARAGIRPGFLVIDDGWQPLQGYQTTSFATDRKKFPRGLAPVVQEAKQKFGVKKVGVWHALQGYWHGVDPKSELGRHYATVPNKTRWPQFKGWGDQFDARRRDLVHPRDIHRFYHDFYLKLRAEGIGLVKVDNQGSLEHFARGPLPLSATHRAYQEALQGAASVHFGGNLLHCMSNTHDIALAMGSGMAWRNSDDFYPRKDAAAQAKHVVVNVLNNLWTHTFGLPDWDMFWSRHPHAAYHARARAISGGPVYVSDRPGRHDAALLRKLVLADGRALRWPQPALPSPASVYRDPRHEPCLLKSGNHLGDLGAVAVFHAQAGGPALADRVSPADATGLRRGRYAAFRQGTGELRVLEPGQAWELRLASMESELFHFAPIDQDVAVLGLLDKFNGPAAVAAYGWGESGHYRADVAEGGRIGFYARLRPRRVTVNDRPASARWDRKSGLLVVAAKSRGPACVELYF